MSQTLCILESNGIYRLYKIDDDVDEIYEWNEEPIEEDDCNEIEEAKT